MDFFRVTSETAPVQPEIIITVLGVGVTNAMFMGVLVTVLVTLVAFAYTRRPKLIPGTFQTMIEMAVGSFYHLVEQISPDTKTAQKLLPLIGAIFVFFGISNLIGLIPGLTAITYDGTPIFRTPTNDFNMTFSVATAMILLTQYASIRAFGPFGHLGKYFKFKELFLGFKKGLKEGIFAIIDFLIALLDIISEFAKVFSLSLRLFGNMYAGEILMAVLLGAFAAVIPSVWLAMNLLVGVLQAMVFGALTAAYYSLAVQKSEAAEDVAL